MFIFTIGLLVGFGLGWLSTRLRVVRAYRTGVLDSYQYNRNPAYPKFAMIQRILRKYRQ